MDFRDVTALLHGAAVDISAVSLPESRVTLRMARAASETLIVFAEVETLRCTMVRTQQRTTVLETVGLEKLGAGELWRLYAQAASGVELELGCRAILCDGAEVTGIGRSYRH